MANLTQAARLGFQSGQEQGQTNVNPLGQFVRGMLATMQQRQAVEAEYGMKRGLAREEYGMKLGLAEEEAKIKQKYPSVLEQAMAKTISGDAGEGGIGGDLIYRRADTGEEVTKETALSEIARGNRNFVMSQRQVYRSGVKENPLIKPPDYSPEESSFIADAPAVMDDLKNLMNELTPQTKAPWGGFARVSSGKRYLLPEKELRGLQEKYIRARKTILFGPAGKALTGTEREVVESALTPTGKSPVEWERDLKKAYDVLNNKYAVVTKVQLPNSNPIGKDKEVDYKSLYGLD